MNIKDFPQLNNVQYLMYTTGKTGGATLYNTLQDDAYSAYHTHSEEYFNIVNGQSNFTLEDFIDYTIENNLSKGRRTYIIDSYRTPIEHTISAFFQNIHNYLPNYKALNINQIIDKFNHLKFYELGNNPSYFYIFKYLKQSTDIQFDFERGYYHKNIDKDISLIKLRLNDIDRWGSILSELIGKEIELKSINLAKDKDYNKIYEQFKDSYRIPIEYLNTLKNNENIVSNEMRKMLTTLEIDNYLDYWGNKYKI